MSYEVAVAGKMSASTVCFGHFFQCKFERRFVKTLAEFIQCFLCGFAQSVTGGFGLKTIEGNLHLDTDSANLTALVLQHHSQFGGKLAQFCSDAGIGDCDAEHAEVQAQYLYLAGLSKMGRSNADKMAL
jgi:hypothetical protein